MNEPNPPQRPSADAAQAAIAHIERLLASDPIAAEQRAAEFLEQAPGHDIALLLRGIARRLSGNAGGAVEILETLAGKSPGAPLVHLQLGLALRENGRSTAAESALRRAVAIKPDYGNAWLALADLLTSTGDRQGADQAFVMHARHSAQDPQLRSATAAIRDRRTADAIAVLNRVLERHPNDVVALCLLAEAVMQERRANDAENLLARCLELAPGYHTARQNYAVVLMRQDRLDEALREADLLLIADPANAAYGNLRAAILSRLGEHERAAAIYRDLLDRFPGQPATWASLGHVLRIVGRRDECVDAYRKAIELAPGFGEAWWNLANLKTLQITDPELESMRAQAQRPELTDEQRLHFHFAIGKALEDRREFAESFRHYAEGNRLRRQTSPHDAGQVDEHVRRCKALFTGAFFAERAGSGSPARDPIFIIGLPRVGSTLVEQILASHSAVEATNELVNISGIALSLGPSNTGLVENRYPELLAGLPRDAFAGLGERYITETRPYRRLGRPFFADKMPNNFAHAGFIHLILPNARIIDVRRHPMACGWSLFKHLFARGQSFSYGLGDIAAYYRSYVELMAHFDAVLPGRVYRLHYESLVADTAGEVRRLLDHCGLPFEDACLKFHDSRRAVSTPSSEQVRSPIFRDALDQWRHYEPWLGTLREALGDCVDAYPAPPAQ